MWIGRSVGRAELNHFRRQRWLVTRQVCVEWLLGQRDVDNADVAQARSVTLLGVGLGKAAIHDVQTAARCVLMQIRHPALHNFGCREKGSVQSEKAVQSSNQINQATSLSHTLCAVAAAATWGDGSSHTWTSFVVGGYRCSPLPTACHIARSGPGAFRKD